MNGKKNGVNQCIDEGKNEMNGWMDEGVNGLMEGRVLD